jgi:Alw26I/Eco31I/Esp3I family type II restriction endonuclease
MKFIVEHSNYKGMPEPYKEDKSIRWVVSGDSEIGKKRDSWWIEKVNEKKSINKAEVARAVHPEELGGMKPCQICGRKLSINYVYPNKNSLKRLNKVFHSNYSSFDNTIGEILQGEFGENGENVYKQVKEIFKIAEDLKHDISTFVSFILENRISNLSPGVMSNPPDRFDGFHTYNACCRGKEDTGRHKENMATYTQDRRAYEYWSEGDFNLANRLMGEYRKDKTLYKCPNCGKMKNMSADHVGPISLGFTQRPFFNPLCLPCNSGKNNRLTCSDVEQLLKEEKSEKVISWHSKYIWDLLKNKIKNDEDAIKLSRLMATNMQNVLQIFSEINSKKGEEFLKRYLKPEYAFVDYRFENFNPLDLTKLKVIRSPLDSKNKQKNSERYIRVSFETLKEFQKKENRRVKGWNNKDVDEAISETIKAIEINKFEEADIFLKGAFEKLAIQALSQW